MAGTPVICHAFVRCRRMIHGSNQIRRPDLPLTQTRETSELNSKKENQSNEQ